jgi:glucokinase
MIIAADIGGTKVDIAAFEAADPGAGVPAPILFEKYFTRDFSDFYSLLASFLELLAQRPSTIVIGIAGPVWGDRVKLTNLDWVLDRNELQQQFACEHVAFLNDMEAHAYGALATDASGVKVLNPGKERVGNRALIAAGTGLGEAFMVWDGARYLPVACEGGHTSFAPQSQLESDLLKFAQERHHHVSAERLISGSLGFPILRDFFAASGRLNRMDQAIRNRLMATDHVGPIVAELADAGDPVGMEMMKVFVAMYGAEASNLVLKVNGIGGLYIGGGIAKKIYHWLNEGTFLAAFGNKGRFRELMESIPIWVISDEQNALRGLASYAKKLLS